jgi:hypothetical protein
MIDDSLLPFSLPSVARKKITYLELPGDNHIPLQEPEVTDRIVGEVGEPAPAARLRSTECFMFTDIATFDGLPERYAVPPRSQTRYVHSASA